MCSERIFSQFAFNSWIDCYGSWTPESAWATARLEICLARSLIAILTGLDATEVWFGELIGCYVNFIFSGYLYPFGMSHHAQGSLCDPTIIPVILAIF